MGRAYLFRDRIDVYKRIVASDGEGGFNTQFEKIVSNYPASIDVAVGRNEMVAGGYSHQKTINIQTYPDPKFLEISTETEEKENLLVIKDVSNGKLYKMETYDPNSSGRTRIANFRCVDTEIENLESKIVNGN